METDEQFFSFTVKTEFESKHRFKQCGMVQGQFNLVFMHVVRKILHLELYLQI